MKKLIKKVTWVKAVVFLMVVGSGVMGWQWYEYLNQPWYSKLF